MTWLFVIALIALIAVGFLLALGLLGDLPDAEQDLRPEIPDGAPSFDVVVRGYRMDEVDARLQAMQEQIDALQGRRDHGSE